MSSYTDKINLDFLRVFASGDCLTVPAIAAKVSLSYPATRRRVERLEASGCIKRADNVPSSISWLSVNSYVITDKGRAVLRVYE